MEDFPCSKCLRMVKHFDTCSAPFHTTCFKWEAIERIFSTLKILKVDKQSSLGNDLLNDLLVLNTDCVSLKDFSPDHSIHMWWNAKTRRPNQQPRKQYRRHSTEAANSEDSHASDSDAETDNLPLDDWDEWMTLSTSSDR